MIYYIYIYILYMKASPLPPSPCQLATGQKSNFLPRRVLAQMETDARIYTVFF